MTDRDIKKYRYILRYAVQPGHHEEEAFDSLLKFCKAALIDEVMFFINCEELNNGHITREETKPWMDTIKKGGMKLKDIGVAVSINPWITLLHADRGRRLKEGQKFNLMVDVCGNSASATVCPECREWREYIKDLYSFYAELEPDTIWVEDDFRFHNHAPLIWGGCFCEEHMRLYSEQAGKTISREELIEAILKPGEPHPYRKVWLDTCRNTMVDLAREIGESVHRISPSTKVGLMSSNPSVHCAEARDWEGILRGLSGDITPMVNRPHLPAYSSETPQNYLRNFSMASRLSVANVPEETLLYLELESFPHTTFSKSKTFTQYQLETSLAINADGITLNIFDMMGNGVMEGEGYDKVLRESKEFLSKIRSFRLKASEEKGIRVLFSPSSSYTINTSLGYNMEELYPKESFWAALLSSFSISNVYCSNTNIKDTIAAISGQYLRNLRKEEIIELFENNFIILNAESAYVLYHMGLGYLAGIAAAKWHRMESGFCTLEEVVDGKTYAGIKNARISCQVSAGDFLEIEYEKSPYIITEVLNSEMIRVAKGMTIVYNKVLILPYGNFTQGYNTHLNTIRQEIIKESLKNLVGYEKPLFLEAVPYVCPYHFVRADMDYILVSNSSDDDVEEVKFNYSFNNYTDVEEVDRWGSKVVKLVYDKGSYYIKTVIRSKETKLFIIKK